MAQLGLLPAAGAAALAGAAELLWLMSSCTLLMIFVATALGDHVVSIPLSLIETTWVGFGGVGGGGEGSVWVGK